MILLSLALFFFSSPTQAAIELSLESNRVERGNIGYVDMEALFQKFPETIAAKKKFKADIQKAEDKINLEKIGVIHLRQDLSELRMERRLALKNKNAPVVLPAVSTSPVKAATVQASSSPVVVPPIAPLLVSPSSASPSVELSSAVAQEPAERSLISAMPGFGNVSSSSPVHEASRLPVAISSGVQTSSIAIKSPPTISVPAVHKTVVAAPLGVSPSLFAPDLASLNIKIDKEKMELGQKKSALKQDEAIIEKSLLNLEDRETAGLLGKIYKVIREVATESGVSVVVDKKQILYGHDAVDLTGKVLERLNVLKESGGFNE